jgi:hypothetical protein
MPSERPIAAGRVQAVARHVVGRLVEAAIDDMLN